MVIHVCFKCMFQVFHLFQTYVGSVSSECCKSGYGCCIYMHVVSVCFQVFQVFHTYVASVSSECCICFAMATHVFSWCFRHMLQVFSFGCCKTRSGVAHVAIGPTCLPQLLGRRRGTSCGRLRLADAYKRSSTGEAGDWDPRGRRRSRVREENRASMGVLACERGVAWETGRSPPVQANPTYARVN
jgi:hypothetical protein